MPSKVNRGQAHCPQCILCLCSVDVSACFDNTCRVESQTNSCCVARVNHFAESEADGCFRQVGGKRPILDFTLLSTMAPVLARYRDDMLSTGYRTFDYFLKE